MPMPNIETIYREFIKKNNTNKKKFRKMQEEIEWDYITTDEEATIKCRVDMIIKLMSYFKILFHQMMKIIMMNLKGLYLIV